MSKKDKYLTAVFHKAGIPTGPGTGVGNRYVPRAYSKGRTGWGVFDRQEGRFVELKELLKLDFERVATAHIAN